MANNTIKRVWKQAGINIEDLSSMLFQAESGGHTFAISGVDADGNPVALSGTPAGVFLRPDNTDVALTCSVSNGVVYATLPAECYAVQGRGGVTIFLTSGGQKSAIYAAVVSIGKTTSGNVSPGTTASVVDLINAINAAIAQIPASDTNLKAAMAPTYSTSAVYAVGDYAWNNGVLYRCTTAITSGETWTSGHWTAAAIGSDSAAGLRDLKSAISNTTKSVNCSDKFYNTDMNRKNIGKNDYLYNLRKLTGNAEPTEDLSGTRIRIVYIINAPAFVNVKATSGAGMIINSYNVIDYAINAYEYYAQQITGETYTTSEITAFVNAGKYLSISLKKADGSAISDAERTVLFNALSVTIVPQSEVSYQTSKCEKFREKEDYFCKFLKTTSDDKLQDDANPTRFRIIYKVKKNEVVQIENSENPLFSTVYSGLKDAVYSGTYQGRLQYLTADTYTSKKVIAEIMTDGYMSISMKKSDESAISSSEMQEMYNNLSVSILPSESYFSEIKLSQLFVSNLVQKSSAADGYRTSTKRMTMDSTLALPKGSLRKLMVLVNSNYKVGIRTGKTSTNLNNNQFWYKSGEWITIPKNDNYYRLTVANVLNEDSADIDPTADFRLKAYFKDEDSVLDDDSCKRVTAVRFNMTAPRSINSYPFILHTSDCHGDVRRVERFIRYAEELGADVACVTGDVTSYDPSSGIKWFQDIVNKTNVDVCVCTGNHDVYNLSYEDDDIYDYFFDGMATKLGISNGKTWYYKDLSDKKIRIISINLYQYGGESRWYSHFSDEQLSFLVSALASTPSNYGVMIMAHDPQKALSNAKDENYPTFFQNSRLYDSPHIGITGYPIFDIVDAFIGRTTLTKTYTQTGSPSSVYVSADFTNVDASIEFIAHMTGHFHQDTICYVPGTTEKQLMLNVTCTNSIYGGSEYPYLADLSDIGRSKSGASQDAFNAYIVDRTNKTVKVVRIGQTLIYDLSERKYMEIPYKDNT